MKKILPLSFTLFILSTLQAQSRSGYTANEIINEFSNQTLYNGVTNDGIPYIYFETYDYLMVYYFNENRQCFMCLQVVKNISYLNFKVEKLNKECVIVSDKEWKLYHLNGNITKIKLDYIDGNNVFIFY